MARASCKAPMELLQQQVAGSPFCDWPADIQTSKLCFVCSKDLGSPEIWPEPAARLQWNFCNSKLQDLHFVACRQISACSGHTSISVLFSMLLHIYDSLLVWISAGRPENGDSAVCCCKSSIGALQPYFLAFQLSAAYIT